MSGKSPLRVLLAMRRHVESFAQIPFCFREAGLDVEVAYTLWTKSICFSKHVNKFHLIAYPSEDFACELLEVIHSQHFDFVFFVDEPAITAIYSSPSLSDYSRWLPFPSGSPLEKCIGNKNHFQAFMESNKLPTPKTFLVSTIDEARERSAELGLPVIIKEPDSTSGNGVFIIQNEKELNATLNALKASDQFIVQQFIEGQTVAATFLAFNGVLKCDIIVEKKVALYSGKGPSVVGQFIENESIRETCKKIAMIGDLSGITGLDFMIDAQGNAYGIDPHFGRMTTHVHFGPFCGIHFGHMLRECLEGNLAQRTPKQSSVSMVKYPECISLIFQGGLPILLRQFPLHKKTTVYLFKQPEELCLCLVQGFLAIYWGFRCIAGAIKARCLQK
jgi:predicted ATP-grasp superfamily ATP-dependent carboligase